jgi:hypothetical protein
VVEDERPAAGRLDEEAGGTIAGAGGHRVDDRTRIGHYGLHNSEWDVDPKEPDGQRATRRSASESRISSHTGASGFGPLGITGVCPAQVQCPAMNQAEDSDGSPWLSVEAWRAKSAYHPSPQLHAFLLNLVVNHHCEVDMRNDLAVFLSCGCEGKHLQAIATEVPEIQNYAERVIAQVRASFPCCF